MFSVLVIRLRSLRLLRVSGIVMRLRMFLLLITFLKASHSFRNRLLVICKNAYLFATMIMTRDRKSGSAGMPRPISYAVFCLKKKTAYMDPWVATEPMNWWTLVNRCRALENVAYVVAANQGASLRHYPPYSWPGGSQVIDFDGRVLAEASPGPGERIVVAPIDVSAVRHERDTRIGHLPL